MELGADSFTTFLGVTFPATHRPLLAGGLQAFACPSTRSSGPASPPARV
jgi:ABC-type sulfate transport system permease component